MSKIEQIERITSKPLDPRLIDEVKKNKSTLDYISGNSMIALMNEAFNHVYSIEFGEPRVIRYEKLKAKDGSDYFPKQIVEIKCTITVPIIDPITGKEHIVKREGFGTAVMKKDFEEMILKSAQTDAMKKAAYSFGFAQELFFTKPKEKDYCAENLIGIWTKESMQKHAQAWNVIKNFMAKNNIGNDYNRVAKIVYKDSEARLVPKNIEDVVEKLKQMAKEKVA